MRTLGEIAADLEESARVSDECSLRDTADRIAVELQQMHDEQQQREQEQRR